MTETASPIDPKLFRQVLGHYPTGVCVVTAQDGDTGVGLVVGSFTSVSLNPPLVAFFPDKSSTSWPRIERTGHFCVNILGHDQIDLCRRFASKADNKFEGVGHRTGGTGAPIIDEVVAWIDCRLHAVHEAGDHYIVLGAVEALEIGNARSPLLFFQGSYGQFDPLPPAA